MYNCEITYRNKLRPAGGDDDITNNKHLLTAATTYTVDIVSLNALLINIGSDFPPKVNIILLLTGSGKSQKLRVHPYCMYKRNLFTHSAACLSAPYVALLDLKCLGFNNCRTHTNPFAE